jgi:hypothetical protein
VAFVRGEDNVISISRCETLGSGRHGHPGAHVDRGRVAASAGWNVIDNVVYYQKRESREVWWADAANSGRRTYV